MVIAYRHLEKQSPGHEDRCSDLDKSLFYQNLNQPAFQRGQAVFRSPVTDAGKGLPGLAGQHLLQGLIRPVTIPNMIKLSAQR